MWASLEVLLVKPEFHFLSVWHLHSLGLKESNNCLSMFPKDWKEFLTDQSEFLWDNGMRSQIKGFFLPSLVGQHCPHTHYIQFFKPLNSIISSLIFQAILSSIWEDVSNIFHYINDTYILQCNLLNFLNRKM